MSSDPPIVISGGSITIEFDQSEIPSNSQGGFHSSDKTIKHIEITGDYDPETGAVVDGNVTIRVSYSSNDATK
jgi:exosome complex RNA-binding protein Rrp4